jgi:hypothetical protein
VCAELFGERCDEHQSYGLERVVRRRYLPAHGASGTVEIRLLRFATAEGALASFARWLGEEQDSAETRWQPYAMGDVAALDAEDGLIVQGQHLAHLRYHAEQQAAESTRDTARTALTALMRALSARLPRGKPLPDELVALPVAERVPLGARYVMRDALDIAGAGPGAMGYYQRGSKRWRVLSIHRADPDAAKDAAATLRKVAGWMPHKDTPYGSFKLTFPIPDTGLSVEWVITQQLDRVWGVGDEIDALDPSLSDADLATRRLSYTEKLEQLGKLLHAAR